MNTLVCSANRFNRLLLVVILLVISLQRLMKQVSHTDKKLRTSALKNKVDKTPYRIDLKPSHFDGYSMWQKTSKYDRINFQPSHNSATNKSKQTNQKPVVIKKMTVFIIISHFLNVGVKGQRADSSQTGGSYRVINWGGKPLGFTPFFPTFRCFVQQDTSNAIICFKLPPNESLVQALPTMRLTECPREFWVRE